MPPIARLRVGTLVTSINPTMVRTRDGVECGPQYQRECIDSWIAAGFDVVSVNPKSEAAMVANLGLAVRVEEVDDKGPPLIRDLVRFASSSHSNLVGIINSDCVLYSLADGIERIEHAIGTAVVIAERVNIEPFSQSFASDPLGGFDAFFFARPSQDLIEELEQGHSFRIGDLWWDCWFPCIFLARGKTVRQCMLPILSHLEHERSRKPDVYLRNGELFRRELLRLTRGRPESCLSEVLANLPALETITLRDLAYGIHAKLWNSVGAAPLSCGPKDLLELERYVYFLRNYHRWSSQQNSREEGLFSLVRRFNHRRLDRRRTERAKRLVDDI